MGEVAEGALMPSALTMFVVPEVRPPTMFASVFTPPHGGFRERGLEFS
jgi:hypothetical protein